MSTISVLMLNAYLCISLNARVGTCAQDMRESSVFSKVGF
jgi:hypothetical protein